MKSNYVTGTPLSSPSVGLKIAEIPPERCNLKSSSTLEATASTCVTTCTRCSQRISFADFGEIPSKKVGLDPARLPPTITERWAIFARGSNSILICFPGFASLSVLMKVFGWDFRWQVIERLLRVNDLQTHSYTDKTGRVSDACESRLKSCRITAIVIQVRTKFTRSRRVVLDSLSSSLLIFFFFFFLFFSTPSSSFSNMNLNFISFCWESREWTCSLSTLWAMLCWQRAG